MKPAIAWTLSAVTFVAMFIGARVYIARELARPLESTPVVIQSVPRPQGGAIRTAVRWIEAAIAGEPGAADAAHAALDRVASRAIEATEAHEAAAALAPLHAALDEAGQPVLAAHVMHTRARLAQQSGAPDAALEAALEARRAESPAHFDWTAPDDETDEDPGSPEGATPDGERPADDAPDGEIPM